MEPKMIETPADFLAELIDKKIALRYKQRPEGGGQAAPYEGILIARDGTFLKVRDPEAYQGRGAPKKPDVLVAIDSLATIEELP